MRWSTFLIIIQSPTSDSPSGNHPTAAAAATTATAAATTATTAPGDLQQLQRWLFQSDFFVWGGRVQGRNRRGGIQVKNKRIRRNIRIFPEKVKTTTTYRICHHFFFFVGGWIHFQIPIQSPKLQHVNQKFRSNRIEQTIKMRPRKASDSSGRTFGRVETGSAPPHHYCFRFLLSFPGPKSLASRLRRLEMVGSWPCLQNTGRGESSRGSSAGSSRWTKDIPG